MLRIRGMNIKWRIMASFFILSLLVTVASFIALYYFFPDNSLAVESKVSWALLLILLGQVIGYWEGRSVQRRMDTLYLAMLELSKGNYKNRLKEESDEAFQYIYEAFDNMAASFEERTALLQKIGMQDMVEKQQIVEEAVLEERRRLARDLHDTVSQELFAIHMSASSLPKMIEMNPQAVSSVMEQLIAMSNHAQKQMRGLITQLRPIELDGTSLEEALEKWFPDYCRANGLQGVMNVELHDEIESEAIEHQVFLIIQETMANVVKHAAASHVTLSFHEYEHQYVLQLVDDGVGFDRNSIANTSHGLNTIRERAQKLGGDAQVISKIDAGTRVKVQIPKFTDPEDRREEENEQ
ncbi:sensor histidine kinase [Paenibacillus sp. N1-5-1-14]|uniref:sensor histidine kinase n=1 Tax=Paenibacillus radicibacter TaxID=2972488 RepID=UPI002158B6CB|nr:sensor histidine kinase [Paenibacillus radicibacter]MCR8643149.1 sensor histidine kinase [Paenibacillus radicibacter]